MKINGGEFTATGGYGGSYAILTYDTTVDISGGTIKLQGSFLSMAMFSYCKAWNNTNSVISISNSPNVTIKWGERVGEDEYDISTPEQKQTYMSLPEGQNWVNIFSDWREVEFGDDIQMAEITNIEISDFRGFDSFADAIESGATEDIVIDMNGATIVPARLFEAAKGKDVTITFDMGNGIKWTINGNDITGTEFDNINLSTTMGADAGKLIPVDVINAITGEKTSVNLSLDYDGDFGFKAVLTVNLDAKNSGNYANLFYYNPSTNKLEYVCASKIDTEGNAELTFTHASDYVIVISDKDMYAAPDEEDIPTGDNSSLWVFVLAVVSLIAIVGLAKKVREKPIL